MKRLFLLTTLIASLLMISGCNKDNGDDSTSTSAVSELDGTWEHHTQIYNILNGYMPIRDYNGDSVADVIYIFIYTGTKTLQINNQIVNKVTVSISQYLLTPLTEDEANTYNANMKCGYSDWTVNMKKDITPCKKSPTGPMPSIYLVDGNNLMWGWGDTSSIGEDGYPDALDPTDVWYRK